ncbi:MAG: cation diffusion facilitator family transporter [Methanosarcinales archaeon]|nr:cation diffusion facilitator family transporter [Methanosarcinales archaeon]
MRRVAIYSLLVNLFLVGTKLYLSIVSGSLALRADAVHSSVDVFVSLALIAGLFIASRKSRSFPYGLYKVENLVSVIISLLLFLTAWEIVREALSGEMVAGPHSDWTLLALVAALIPIPLIFGSYEIREGRRARSPSLVADGSQFRADALTASLVFFALVGQRMGYQLDRAVAAVIALFILRAGWEILLSGMRVLLDASVDSKTLESIRSLIEADPAVTSLQDVTARNSGRYLFVEASIATRTADLQKATQVGRRIESRIRDRFSHVDRVLIHYEPQSRTHLRYAVALSDSGGQVSSHFGQSPYFALVDLDVGNRRLIRQAMVSNPHLDLAKGRGLEVARFLLSHKPDVVISRESLSGKGPGYAFAEMGVETVRTDESTLSEVIEGLQSEGGGDKNF